MTSSTKSSQNAPESTFFSDVVNPKKRTIIRDRRDEVAGEKFGTDVDRFMRRVLDRVKQAIQDDITQGNLGDIGRGAIKVPIPKSLTHEPYLHFAGMGKKFTRVFPGNKGLMASFDSVIDQLPAVFPGQDNVDTDICNVSFDVGDKVPIPRGGGGGSGGKPGQGEPSDSGEGDDDFIWVNEADYLDILFDGRKLPDMTKLKSKDTQVTQPKQVGQTFDGSFDRLNRGITEKVKHDEDLVASKVNEHGIFANLSEQFNIFTGPVKTLKPFDIDSYTLEERNVIILDICNMVFGEDRAHEIDAIDPEDSKKVAAIFKKAIDHLNDEYGMSLSNLDADELETLRIIYDGLLEFGDKIGKYRNEQIRYNYDRQMPKPNAKAVMFCLMDVSGSMGQEEKNTAKVFFWLLKKFLDANYKQVEMVYIAHTTEAKEVDEKTFFYGTETGGTIVSTCLEKTKEILKERYALDEWNVYSAQASDGDNSYSDNDNIVKVMDELLPMIQAHYYLEVASAWRGRVPSAMYKVYEKMSQDSDGKIKAKWGIRGAPGALDAFTTFFPVGGAQPNLQTEMGF